MTLKVEMGPVVDDHGRPRPRTRWLKVTSVTIRSARTRIFLRYRISAFRMRDREETAST